MRHCDVVEKNNSTACPTTTQHLEQFETSQNHEHDRYSLKSGDLVGTDAKKLEKNSGRLPEEGGNA